MTWRRWCTPFSKDHEMQWNFVIFWGKIMENPKKKKKFRFHRFDWLHFLSCCVWSCSLWWGSISFDRLIQVIVELLPVVSLAVYIPTQFSTAWVESTKAVVGRAVLTWTCVYCIYIYTHNTYIMFTKSIVHTLHVLCLLYICTILCVCVQICLGFLSTRVSTSCQALCCFPATRRKQR